MTESTLRYPAYRWAKGLHAGDWYTQMLAQPMPTRSLADETMARRLMSLDTRDRMMRMLREAYSFAINTGAATNTRVCWVGGERGFWGAAGFEDCLYSLERPYMLLHESIANLQAITGGDAATAYQVFIGVCIHEAGHLAYTRIGYWIDPEMTTSTRERLFVNLLEDNRIESLVANDLVGWRPYLMTARTTLHAEAFSPIVSQWRDMRTSEKVAVMATQMIRAPERILDFQIDDAQQPGRRWLDRLATILGEPPETEQQVWRMAGAVNQFLHELDEIDGETNDDCVFVPDAEFREGRPAAIWNRGDFSETPIADLFDVADRLGDFLKDNLDDAEVLIDSSVVGSIVGAEPTCVLPSTDQETRGRLVWAEANSNFKTQPTGEHLFSGFSSVVQQLRAAWHQPPGRHRVRTHLRSGRLDRRRLHAAAFDSRLFQNIDESPPHKPTDLVVLLDASGSMTGDRHRFATQAGLLVTEAFHNHPGICINLFSHSAGFTGGTLHDDNLRRSMFESCQEYVFMTHLFGGHVTGRCWQDAYALADGNEDYTAIEAVANRMMKDKSLHRPILMVVSDGEPCGDPKNGQSPITRTRLAVDDLRTLGWRVFSLGLGNDQACETIYGREFTRQVDHEAELPRKLRNLIVQCSRTS